VHTAPLVRASARALRAQRDQLEGENVRTLTYMWKDADSIGGSCPAIYSTDGGYVVQGIKLTENERAQLRNLADTEDGVFVPANVLDRLRGTA
jgi:hypothetical protein